MTHRYLTLTYIAIAAVIVASCASKGGGADAKTGDDVAVVDSVAVDDEFDEPVIDESTLIQPNDSMTFEPSELCIPSRRFYSKERAMEYMEESAESEKYLSGIFPKMLEENLEYADRLLNSDYEHFIVADKQSMRVVLFDRYGHVVKSYPMAAARNFGTKHRKRDSRTPEGFFYAQGVYDSTDWLFTDDDGNTSPNKGQYGPRFIRVTTMIGIHGTSSSRSLGKRASHGCLRISNDDIMDLVGYVTPGMPIIINPGDRDVAVNRSEGYDIPQISVGLDPADSSLNYSLEVSASYPARPDKVDKVVAAVVDSVATAIEPVDSLGNLRHELPEVPDSVH